MTDGGVGGAAGRERDRRDLSIDGHIPTTDRLTDSPIDTRSGDKIRILALCTGIIRPRNQLSSSPRCRVRSTRGKRKGLADHGISQTRSQTAGQQLDDFPFLLDCACGAKSDPPVGCVRTNGNRQSRLPFQTYLQRNLKI